MEHQKNFDKDPKEKEFVEKLVTLNRTCKTVKGGRRMSFSALTVVGDGKGRVGYGLGKANDVSEAIKKSIDRAKRNLVVIPMKNGTLPHEITVNVVRATFDAISKLMDAKKVAANRGKTLDELWG